MSRTGPTPGRRAPSTCAWMQEHLTAYVLEDLSRRETLRARGHLARCPACRARAARERDLLAMVPQALRPVEPPHEVLERLLRRVRSRRRPWALRVGLGALAAAALVAAVVLTREPAPVETALRSPDVAVIDLFVALDSPITARYEFRRASQLHFDRSVGRILFNVRSGQWRLLVHGLPRPPRGARYVLTAQLGPHLVPLGTIADWSAGVAQLSGTSPFDLTGADRLSVELVTSRARVRLLDASQGAW